MLKVYLDTNIYYISRRDPDTNSRILINAAIGEQIEVVQSDYLYDEVHSLFKRLFDKDIAGYERQFMQSLPLKSIVYKEDWLPFAAEYRRFVKDIDDFPHICSYFAGNCDYFVTTNRRLTKMKIKERVNFISPQELVEEIGLEPIITIDKI